ncbi:MAG: Hsp20/alpha crystallin family protein [Prevotellaceae bacterium]|jgi:HSP20 family protein|nr:Hsp20/alpha crystallin family protein [Prevotellaceae bacterium]
MLPTKRNQNWLPSIFQDFFGNEWLQKTSLFHGPAVNIIETDKEYKIEVAAPGMTKDDFVVKIENENELVISFEKKEEKNEKDEKKKGAKKKDEKEGKKEEGKNDKYLRREFSHTQFKQLLLLPENIDKNKIEAKVSNGILTVTISKKELRAANAKGKLITVK